MKRVLLTLLLALSCMHDGAQAMKRRTCYQGSRVIARRLCGTSRTFRCKRRGARVAQPRRKVGKPGSINTLVRPFSMFTINGGADGYNDDDAIFNGIDGYSDIDLDQLSQRTLDELIAAAGGSGDDNELPVKHIYRCDRHDWVGYSSRVYSLVQNLSSNLGRHYESLFNQFGTLYELLVKNTEFKTFIDLYENLYQTDKLKFFHRIEEDFSHRSPVLVGEFERFDTERYMSLLKQLINASKTMNIGSGQHISLLKEFTMVCAKWLIEFTEGGTKHVGYKLTPQAIHRIALWYMTFYKVHDCFRTNK